MQITRRIVFHTGHMLKDDTSKCYQPHGHEYVLECTIDGDIQEKGAENGMVMNFGSLKQIMMEEVHDRLDHRFLVEYSDPRCERFLHAIDKEGCFITSFPPTAEHLVRWMFNALTGRLPQGVKIIKLKLQETYQCWAEYHGNN